MPAPRRIVVALTGASGVHYGVDLLRKLVQLEQPVDLLLSEAAAMVLKTEWGPGEWIKGGRAQLADFGLEGADIRTHDHKNIAAAIASGTALRRGMVIVPCSMGTLGRLAAGISSNLIERAADVCLKERRPLVLAWRETPLSLIHLRNMTSLAEAGAILLPTTPGFYGPSETVQDLLDQISGKILDTLDIAHDFVPRWGGDS
ncbi:MAG: flavin prenyltransferase UbiX [Planctomycetota bacterium]